MQGTQQAYRLILRLAESVVSLLAVLQVFFCNTQPQSSNPLMILLSIHLYFLKFKKSFLQDFHFWIWDPKLRPLMKENKKFAVVFNKILW